ncbi:MAG TPA: HEPN domain-containing protein [Chloroflexi bacterium]|nr:HEPN domain-containing protein [Chloroflexota bacterium]
MRPDLEEEARWWLAQARSDFSALDVLFRAGKYDLVCFLSQQVAEKALKAYLIAQGEELILSHSVARLCSMAAEFDPAFSDLRREIKALTPYYVEARYPNALEEIPAVFFDENDAQEAMEMAEKALRFVERRFEKT